MDWTNNWPLVDSTHFLRSADHQGECGDTPLCCPALWVLGDCLLNPQMTFEIYPACWRKACRAHSDTNLLKESHLMKMTHFLPYEHTCSDKKNLRGGRTVRLQNKPTETWCICAEFVWFAAWQRTASQDLESRERNKKSSQAAGGKHFSWWASVHGINYLPHNWCWITIM
jgi:hypothetical protein